MSTPELTSKIWVPTEEPLAHPTQWGLYLYAGRLFVEVEPYQDEYGYLCVTLTVSGRTRHEKLHRLLWEFYNRRKVPEGLLVRHLNDVKLDNRETNLALGSHQDNMEDRKRNGNDPVGVKNPACKLDEPSVRELRKRHRTGESLTSLAKEYGVSRTAVTAAVRGETWAHVKDEGE